jgi:hypothetical protein
MGRLAVSWQGVWLAAVVFGSRVEDGEERWLCMSYHGPFVHAFPTGGCGADGKSCMILNGEWSSNPATEIDVPMSRPRIVFTLSLATLLTTAVHRPETLRGLSRWTLDLVLRGPNALRVQKKRADSPEVLDGAVKRRHTPKLLDRRK